MTCPTLSWRRKLRLRSGVLVLNTYHLSHVICMALGLVCRLYCLPWNTWHRFLHSNDIACFRQILKIAENAVVELASAWGGMTSLVELEAQVRRAGGLAAENKDSANV